MTGAQFTGHHPLTTTPSTHTLRCSTNRLWTPLCSITLAVLYCSTSTRVIRILQTRAVSQSTRLMIVKVALSSGPPSSWIISRLPQSTAAPERRRNACATQSASTSQMLCTSLTCQEGFALKTLSERSLPLCVSSIILANRWQTLNAAQSRAWITLGSTTGPQSKQVCSYPHPTTTTTAVGCFRQQASGTLRPVTGKIVVTGLSSHHS